METGRAGDAVLDVGVGVLLFRPTSLSPLLFVEVVEAILSVVLCKAVVMLAARDGDGERDGEGEEAAVWLTEVVEDDEVVEETAVGGGVGVLEFEGDMNSFRTPAGTDIIGAAAVSRSFMVEREEGWEK